DYSKRKDVEGLIYIASCLRRYVDGLAARLEVGFALEVFQLLNKYTKPVYSDPELPCPSRLQLSDCTAILQIDIVQQSMLRIVDANPNKEIEALADAVFKRNGRTPISTLPATKILVESLAAKVSSERDIEGRVISPRWYIAQLIARSFGEQVDKLFSQLTKIPERPAADLPKPNNFENAAVEILIIQRNMEAVARLISHESKFVRFTQHLKEFEKIKDLPIKNMEEGAATNDFGETMDRCFDRLGDLLLPVFQHHRDIELPDFFGMTYFRLCNELFRQIQENEHARFKQLYPKVLAAAFFCPATVIERIRSRPRCRYKGANII
ncbi:MAG: hypothetical protein P4L58_01870, partial [Candidatus Pacebacteria bacterium]|nr:hypothetical protein [Candidatus Paceibacterota bacterium]